MGGLFGWNDPPGLPPGKNVVPYRSKRHKIPKAPKPPKSGGGKPPKKSGGLCVQIAPYAAWPALLFLGHAIVQSFT